MTGFNSRVAAGWAAWAVFLVAPGCHRKQAECPPQKEKAKSNVEAGSRKAAARATLPKTPWKAAAIAHGGVGSPPDRSDGCRKAVDAALAVLEKGGGPLDAAVAGVVVMEDDPRYNAGTGSRVRLDGMTVQMDAAVMDSTGRFGGVAVIKDVRNPIKVARAVVRTPHLLLSGEGATRFARAVGFPRYNPATKASVAKTRRLQQRLIKNDPKLPRRWRRFDWRKHWNFARSLKDSGMDKPGDTVGVVVRSKDGRFAVALSTGGTTFMLNGRIGDTPILGAGLYAGPFGGAAATGIGERIIEAASTRAVHRWLSRGAAAKEAAQRAVEMLRRKGAIGIIVMGATDMAAAADREMAWAGRVSGTDRWLGPPLGKTAPRKQARHAAHGR